MFIPDSRLHKFAHFKGLRLFFLSNFPEAMFIQGATSILDSRVPMPQIIWQYELSSFQVQDTKLERLLPKNQHTQRK
jgi:hypothetical protein